MNSQNNIASLTILRVLLIVLLLASVISPSFFEHYTFILPADLANTEAGNLIQRSAQDTGISGNTYHITTSFIADLKDVLKHAEEQARDDQKNTIRDALMPITRASGHGLLARNPLPFLLLWLTTALIAMLYCVRQQLLRAAGEYLYRRQAGISRGIPYSWQHVLVLITVPAALIGAYFYSGRNWILSATTLAICVAIFLLVKRHPFFRDPVRLQRIRPAAGGVLLAIFLIGFYCILYWSPAHLMPWIRVTDPLSKVLSGNAASHWFLYGFLYTIVILVFGVRMYVRHRTNRYQLLRTTSVIFFQVVFAFLIPEILIRLNAPYFDFKNIWPLNYTFFFDYNLKELIANGTLGIFMLFWGIVLILIGVPLFTFLYGKRWYCSWVCGCGGLAETAGDSFRQLSDKSIKAWRYERWIIHGVLVFAIVMTAMVLWTFFTGQGSILGINSYSIRGWYGFLIGSVFAGVIGTGFYPVMGSRVWCRFGCPLAAYLGLIQRFRSRFRITVNGGQCISCGNCSTYCEMGIDVRHYAQRGQDIVRASCVGCGICAEVCPRGVLRLENASSNVTTRTTRERTVHVRESDLRLLS